LAWGAPSCTVTSIPIAFGNYDPLSAIALPGTGKLTLNCSSGVGAGVTFVISLNTGSSGSYAARTLKNGALTLSYNLYTTAAYTTVWGNGTAGTATVSAGPYQKPALPVSVTVYGRITALQNAALGAYTDSITATVTF
jgi:spore coat protein U-like protein